MRGAAELRVKESDRITALALGLARDGRRRSTSSPTASTSRSGRCTGGDGRRLRRSSPGDGVRDRRDARGGARRRSPAPPRSTSRTRLLRRRSQRLTRGDGSTRSIWSGFMAAGKTTVARALAGRLGWRAEDIDELIEARERRTVADIFARQGEPYFRARRARDPAAAAAAAPRRRRHRRRHLRRPRQPSGDQPRRRLGLARRAVRGRARPAAADGRRPLAADRAQMERLFATAAARPTPRPRAGRRHRRPRRSGGRANHRRHHSDGASPAVATRTCRYLVLSDIHANLDALDAVLARGRRPTGIALLVLGDLVGYGAEPNARHRPRPRARARSRSSAATTTRRPAGIDDGSNFNHVAQDRGDVDRRDADRRQPRVAARAARRARC